MKYDHLLKLATLFEKKATGLEDSLKVFLSSLKKRYEKNPDPKKLEEIKNIEYELSLLQDMDSPAITRTLYKPEKEYDPEDELSEMEKAIYNV